MNRISLISFAVGVNIGLNFGREIGRKIGCKIRDKPHEFQFHFGYEYGWASVTVIASLFMFGEYSLSPKMISFLGPGGVEMLLHNPISAGVIGWSVGKFVGMVSGIGEGLAGNC